MAWTDMKGCMEIQPDQRSVWDIDKRLESLKGCAVRVQADLVIPKVWEGRPVVRPIDGENLILPDGTSVDRDPIYVEGIITDFRRNVAVVHVELDRLPMEGTVDGRISFRNRTAIILRGPATVQLAHPFTVEMIPSNPQDYWDHLRRTDNQLELRFK